MLEYPYFGLQIIFETKTKKIPTYCLYHGKTRTLEQTFLQEINIRVLKIPTTMFPELRRRHYLTVLKIVIATLYPWGWTHEI